MLDEARQAILDILFPVQEESKHGAQKMFCSIAGYGFDNVSF